VSVLQLTLFILMATLVIAFADEIGKVIKKGNKTILKKSYIKHSVLVVLASVVIISFRAPLTTILDYVSSAYQYLVAVTVNALGVEHAGFILLLRILALLLFSFVPSLIISGLYWLARQQAYPNFYLTLWVTWVILVFSII
jgi:hypothetical protein